MNHLLNGKVYLNTGSMVEFEFADDSQSHMRLFQQLRRRVPQEITRVSTTSASA